MDNFVFFKFFYERIILHFCKGVMEEEEAPTVSCWIKKGSQLRLIEAASSFFHALLLCGKLLMLLQHEIRQLQLLLTDFIETTGVCLTAPETDTPAARLERLLEPCRLGDFFYNH